ncbi:MAG: SGNH/GDSL hydrolase family protein, partial [Candidatus Hinthialibacter sp.]
LPSDPYFAPFQLLQAPQPQELLLKEGDRLAICGDSITEQKMYSRIMETYLTVCVPQFKVEVRQFGWSGEQAPGFLQRMENDVLRFKPSIATTCYGMNDHRYQPYNPEYGDLYRTTSQAIIRAFKENGVRVIQGSPGTIGKMPHWVKQAQGTVNDLNLSLMEFRNIGVQLARQEKTAFADVFTPMLVEGYRAQQKYGDDYMISGKDGVHPGLAGHLVMAYAFLKAMGLDGEIGTIVFDMSENEASASEGHKILAATDEKIQLESERYPFCATGGTDQDSSLRSGMALVPFNKELNRFTLLIKNAPAGQYQLTWGESSKTYSAAELAEGVNLAQDFQINPFSEAFKQVDDAVAVKQAYETKQIKQLFHGEEGRVDMEMTAALTEKVRDHFVQAVQSAYKPVRHTIQIEKK